MRLQSVCIVSFRREVRSLLGAISFTMLSWIRAISRSILASTIMRVVRCQVVPLRVERRASLQVSAPNSLKSRFGQKLLVAFPVARAWSIRTNASVAACARRAANSTRSAFRVSILNVRPWCRAKTRSRRSSLMQRRCSSSASFLARRIRRKGERSCTN